MNADIEAQIDQLLSDPVFHNMVRDDIRWSLTHNPDWPQAYRERSRTVEAEQDEADKELSVALASLYSELETAGLLGKSDYRPYGFLPINPNSEAFALLLKWFPHAPNRLAKHEIVTRLDCPEARNWIPELLSLFRTLDSTDPDGGTNFMFTAVIGKRAAWEHLDSLIDVCGDPAIATIKAPIVGYLWKFADDPRILASLLQLIEEPGSVAIEREALYALRRIGDPSTRYIFERFLDHPDADARKIARAGIAKIDKALARKQQHK